MLNPVEKAERLEDRLVMGHGVAQGSLYLRPGTYRVTSMSEANRVLYRQDIRVAGASTMPSPPAK